MLMNLEQIVVKELEKRNLNNALDKQKQLELMDLILHHGFSLKDAISFVFKEREA